MIISRVDSPGVGAFDRSAGRQYAQRPKAPGPKKSVESVCQHDAPTTRANLRRPYIEHSRNIDERRLSSMNQQYLRTDTTVRLAHGLHAQATSRSMTGDKRRQAIRHRWSNHWKHSTPTHQFGKITAFSPQLWYEQMLPLFLPLTLR